MSQCDARHASPEVQEYLRQQGIHLRKQGKTFTQIAEFLGVNRNTASSWWHDYQRNGETALFQKVRGRKVGQGRQLTPNQESEIQTLILENFPEDIGIDSALWTRRAVQTLSEQHYGLRIPLRSLGDYLKRWGYTPQKPLKRAYEQDPNAVKRWLSQDYRAIKAKAKQEQAEIYWGDQSGLRGNSQRGRGDAPCGQTPEIQLTQKRPGRLNYMASVSNQGKVRFMLYSNTFTSKVMLEFLKRLIQSRERKLYLIVDRHRVHRSQVIRQWLDKHTNVIELFFLPSYSPELNPAEYLNCDVKQGVHSKPPTRNQKQLFSRTLSHLRKLQKLPERIKRYFKHPDIAYAAS